MPKPSGFPKHMFGDGDPELQDVLDQLEDRSTKKPKKKASAPVQEFIPKECMSPDQILWMDFQVKPNWPIRTKVEHLVMFYRLPARDIAPLLQMSEEMIEDEIKALQGDWISMGKIPKGKERDLHRGRVVSKLRRMETTIEAELTSTPGDTKLLTLLLTVQDRIAKIMGLETDKRDSVLGEEVEGDSFTRILQNMSPEKQQELHARLSRGTQPES